MPNNNNLQSSYMSVEMLTPDKDRRPRISNHKQPRKHVILPRLLETKETQQLTGVYDERKSN